LLGLLLSVVAVGAAGAIPGTFYFRGYTYNETNVSLSNTNVTIEVYTMGGPGGPPMLVHSYSNLSNDTGFFNVTGIPNDNSRLYKPVLKHFNDTTNSLDYIGQSLPQFHFK